MAKQGEKLSLDELKTLCNFKKGEYVSKSGDKYVKALEKLFTLKNKNDKPFSIDDIKNQPTFQEFSFVGKDDYKFICELKAEPMKIIGDKRVNERIVALNFSSDEAKNIFTNSSGTSYILTCKIDNKEHIIKIGQTRKTFEERLTSYNCGCVYNWRTASTTNIKIKQSMVATRKTFNLYLYDCSDEPYVLEWHGEHSIEFASPKSLAVEDIMIKKFIEQFGQKPLANIQADAKN
nr:hypothetical protein [uncultured Campylobacter sp.]